MSEIIVLKIAETGQLLHIEGGQRICAAAYGEAVREPINFADKKVLAYVAEIDLKHLEQLKTFLAQGTSK